MQNVDSNKPTELKETKTATRTDKANGAGNCETKYRGSQARSKRALANKKIKNRYRKHKTANTMDLSRLVELVLQLIQTVNIHSTMSNKNECKNSECNDEFDFDNEMDECCMDLFKILFYFVVNPLERNQKEEIYKYRDFVADRMIGLWILDQFKRKLFGKYETFIKHFERDGKSMRIPIKLWCSKSSIAITDKVSPLFINVSDVGTNGITVSRPLPPAQLPLESTATRAVAGPFEKELPLQLMGQFVNR